jgi:uncharacterized membrane protein YtjA (UPF0391 family)
MSAYKIWRLLPTVRALASNYSCSVRFNATNSIQGAIMLSWAVTFFVIALIAAVLGFSGVAGTAANIAWILAVVGVILAIVFFISGRKTLP